MLTPKAYQQAKTLLLTSAVAGAGIVMTLLTGYVMASPTFGWTGAAGSALTTDRVGPNQRIQLPNPHSVARMEGLGAGNTKGFERERGATLNRRAGCHTDAASVGLACIVVFNIGAAVPLRVR